VRAHISDNFPGVPLNQQETLHVSVPRKNTYMILQQSQHMNRERGSSETLRNESSLNFRWFAGLLDADGGFYISRGRYVSCEITMHEKEVQTLHFIKKCLGGSVTRRIRKKAYRWRLHKRVNLETLLHKVNGCFQTERVETPFRNACQVYKIAPLARETLTLETAWLSGFFSGDGSFSINMTARYQPSASIGQAEKSILEKIALLLGGKVYYDVSWNGWIWWVDLRTYPLVLDYLQNYPLNNPSKQARLKSMIRFLGYLERGLHKNPNSQARLRHFVSLFQKN
jgi:ubiquinol-cytochrome c reductase cytochrome b subunit